MVNQAEIQKAVRLLIPTYPLKTVTLFGSYADGIASPESDVDLLVEFQHPAVSLLLLNQLKYDLEDRLGLSVDIIHGPLSEDAMIRPGRMVVLLDS